MEINGGDATNEGNELELTKKRPDIVEQITWVGVSAREGRFHALAHGQVPRKIKHLRM
jgi:hypothetical protein